jgi:lipopolysaccharide transport system permease protein
MNQPAKTDARPGAAGGHRHVVIEPGTTRWWPDFGELRRFRGLLRALVWRNVRVRYKNTALGMFWILLQPFLQMLVYTIIFGVWARIPVGEVPYSIHVLSGLVLVFFVNRVLSESANVVRANQNLTKKVYFPKLVLPCVVVSASAVDLLVSMLLLCAMMLALQVPAHVTAVCVPLVLLWLVAWSFVIAVWFAALGIRFRDVTMITPVLSMLMMYMSPIIYPISIVPEALLPIYSLNPMVGIVTTFRWALLGIEPLYTTAMIISFAEIVVLGVIGLVVFVRTEQSFNDFL